MPPNPYNKLPTTTLATLLLARGLDPTGTKTAMLSRLKKQDAEVEAAEHAAREGVRAVSGVTDGNMMEEGGGGENARPRRTARGRARTKECGTEMVGREYEEREMVGEIEGEGGERNVVRELMEGEDGVRMRMRGGDGIVVNETRVREGKSDGNGNGGVRNRRRARGHGRARKVERGDGEQGAAALEMAEWYLAMEMKRDADKRKMRFLMMQAGMVVGVLVLLVVVVVWMRAGK